MIQFLIVLVLSGGAISGCVTSSKYSQLESEFHSEQEKRRDLEVQLHEKTVLVSQLESRLGVVDASLSETKEALSEIERSKQEAEKRIVEYRDLVARFRSAIDAGRLRVKIVEGRMVVELSSDVLFSSGSSQLSEVGRQNIREVAEQLKEIANRKFQVEGHTDNVPIHTERFRSNWDLASARALNVVFEMVNSGLPPAQISAASFGEYKPISSNEEPKGRAANRRIEIVVVPDLSNLPGMDSL